MSEISERYRRLSEAFAAKLAAVPADRWDSPSPCEGWTARDVARHVVTTQGMFRKLVGREMPELPDFDDDPGAAWDAARSVIQRDLDDPEAATAEYDGQFGRSTFQSAVDRFLCTDLVVHGWDLARAAGLDDRIEPAEMARIAQDFEGAEDAMRSSGAFGPALDVPDDADEQTRFLAFLGRRA